MKTILVVDDMAVFCEPIARSLRSAGYHTLTASNGLEALQLLQNQDVDLVLLDVAMPVMDGLAFLKHVRSDHRFVNLPIVLLTAVAERDYVLKAKQFDVNDYLLKSGFTLAELLRRVEKHIGVGGPNNVTSTPESTSPAAVPAPPPAAQSGSSPGTLPTPTPKRIGNNGQPRSEADLLKDLKPIISRSELEECINEAGDLKALSPTIGQIMKLTQSKECSAEKLAKVIKRDQAVALQLLRLANSAAYSRGEPIETVQAAVLRIGMSQIRQLAMSISVIDRFSHEYERVSGWINTYAFWEHSIATSLIAAKLSRLRGDNDQQVDVMFTAGLLHDVGRMVFVEALGDHYVAALQTADSLGLPLERVEKRMLLMDHADAMDRLLHTWRFAKTMLNPIALHHLSLHNARGMAPKSLAEVSILALANRLAHALLLGSSGNLTLYSTIDYARSLNIKDDQMSRILEGVPDETHDLKLVMLQSAPGSQPMDVRRQTRRRLKMPLRPLFVGQHAGVDAYRLFLETIAEVSTDSKPNLIVAHLHMPRDADDIASMVRRAEAKHDVSDLPMVIISPKGNLTLESKLMCGRRTGLLASPTSVVRFCELVNELLTGTSESPADAAAA